MRGAASRNLVDTQPGPNRELSSIEEDGRDLDRERDRLLGIGGERLEVPTLLDATLAIRVSAMVDTSSRFAIKTALAARHEVRNNTPTPGRQLNKPVDLS